MEIKIYGGINEIGGNKIFININERRFLFDFGLSFNENNQYFSEFLSPRKFNGIIDYLYLGLIPPLNGLYRNDLVIPFKETLRKDPYNIVPSDKSIIDACFLSHAHLDHYKFIGFLQKNTPLYMNWISYVLLDFLTKTTKDSINPEILNFYEFFKTIPKKKQKKGTEIEYKRATKKDYKDHETKRKVTLMRENVPYIFNSTAGNIHITQNPTDHSIPGACSFIVEHDGRSIIYTGDFRRHGVHSEWVENFIRIAQKSNPIAIITEGSRVPSSESFRNGSYKSDDKTEQDVKLHSSDLIKDYPGLILINLQSRNLDRILTYYNLAKKFNRILAVSPKIFLLIDSFKAKLRDLDENTIQEFYNAYTLPEFDDQNFMIYLERKGWGKFELIDYKGLQKGIFKNYKFLTHKDIKKEPERYLLYMDYFMLNELIDLDQKLNSVMFISSTTDPFNEEMVIQEEKLNAWLKRFGVLKTETMHSSGHCFTDQLIEFLQKIDADNIIPIHTENPETFKEFGLSGNVILPKKGDNYFI